MYNYKIEVFNGANVLIYSDIISAKDENEALLIMLETNTIYCDDTIKIKEI